MCAFRFHFWGRKVNWNQASHVRASPVPNLYAGCLNKYSCNLLFVAKGRPLLWILRFCGLIFGTAWRSQKMGPWKCFSFVLLLSCACGPQKWDRQAVPFLGPCLGSFFWSFFVSGVAEGAKFWFQWNFVAYGDRKGQLFPNLYAVCLNKYSCNLLFVARVGLCCGFCDFAVSFLVPAWRSQKWDRESAFLLFFY